MSLHHVATDSAATAALILRLAVGTVFVAHALFKLVVLTLPGTAAFFVEQGFPGWTAYPTEDGSTSPS